MDPFKQTTSPVVVGTSVLGIKYKDGVMMLSDTLASFGGLARYSDVKRLRPVNKHCLIGAGGEYSDFQFIWHKLLRWQTTADFNADDGSELDAREIHAFLARVLYNRRCKFDPLWNQLVVGGFDVEKQEPFLGQVDLYGGSFTTDIAATGYGMYLALPILRKKWREGMSEEEARELLEECMKVLFYRDCRTINKFICARITKEGGPEVSEPYSLETNWEFKRFTDPHDHTI